MSDSKLLYSDEEILDNIQKFFTDPHYKISKGHTKKYVPAEIFLYALHLTKEMFFKTLPEDEAEIAYATYREMVKRAHHLYPENILPDDRIDVIDKLLNDLRAQLADMHRDIKKSGPNPDELIDNDMYHQMAEKIMEGKDDSD